MASTDSRPKRKRPPTLQHYPAERAKKLKQTWVLKAKIKSQWKAQKRNDTALSGAPVSKYEEDIRESDGPDVGSELDARSNEGDVRKSSIPSWSTSRSPKSAKANLPSTKDNRGRQRTSQTKSEDNVTPSSQSLREISRQAYSKSSLHTYKSAPLHKKRGHVTPNDHEPHRKGGKGQPDMKLRMNAMLAKIERDLASQGQ